MAESPESLRLNRPRFSASRTERSSSEIHMGGAKKTGQIMMSLNSEVWITAGSYKYRCWVERGEINFQRYDSKFSTPLGHINKLTLGTEFSLGRSTENSYSLPDPSLSTKHVSLRILSEKGEIQLQIMDVGSTNGTIVQGSVIEEAATRPEIPPEIDRLIENLYDSVFSMHGNMDRFIAELQRLLFGEISVAQKDQILDVLFRKAETSDDKIKLLTIIKIFCGADNGIYSPEKERIFGILKTKISMLGRDFPPAPFDPLSSLEEIMSYLEAYLLESKSQIFQRKFHGDGPIHKPLPKELKYLPLFQDREILVVSRIQSGSEERLPLVHFVKKITSEHGKTVIQQQAKSSCVHACIAMLLFDRGLRPDISNVYFGMYTTPEREKGTFEDLGLNLQTEKVSATPGHEDELLRSLRDRISRNGSCMTGIDGEIGGHEIIVDSVAEDLQSVRLRDPYHGWEITITSEAFLKRLIDHTDNYSTEIAQVQVMPS